MKLRKTLFMKLSRNQIQTVSKFSNLEEKNVNSLLKKNVYASESDWIRFIKIGLLGLGAAFTLSGIVFFFAYNWNDMHKFFKLALNMSIIIAGVSAILFVKFNLTVNKIILTGISILIGVFLAVFGQIYQTGANSFDFFLGWAIFIVIWVLISDFPPLWLIFIILLNTTFITYTQQYGTDWEFEMILNVLFLINVIILTLLIFLHSKTILKNLPEWFSKTIAIFSISAITLSLIIGVSDNYSHTVLISIGLALFLYVPGMYYGIKKRNLFYLAIIPFSIILVIASLLLRITDEAVADMYLIVSLFTIGSITLLIRQIISLRKKWKVINNNEKIIHTN